MKRSWKPQIRSFWMNKPLFWIIFFIIMAILALYLYNLSSSIVAYVIVGIYFMMLFVNNYKLQRWQTSGYEKITIDTNNKCLIFDNCLEIPFNQIYNLSYYVENNPSNSLFMRRDLFFDNGRVDFLNINAVLCISSSTYPNIDFTIHNKLAARQILNTLQKAGLNVYKYDNRTFNFALFIKIVGALVFLAVLFYLYFFIQ